MRINSPRNNVPITYKSSARSPRIAPQQQILSKNTISSSTNLQRKPNSINRQRQYNEPYIDDSYAKGQKAYTFQNEDTFIGEWQNGLPHGYGVYTFSNKKVQYRGSFMNGKMHGSGTLQRLIQKGKPQIIYDGQWMQGQKNGTGKYYYFDTTYYQGSWYKNKKQGHGIFKSPQGEYVGQWKNDKKHGKGRMTTKNGQQFDGVWQNDEFKQGNVTYSNGDIYNGQLKNFQRQGQGQYIYASNQEKYQGTWSSNKKQGKGVISYQNSDKFQGNFTNDKRQGQNCNYKWKNGTQILCSFDDNIPVRGKMIIPNKQTFQFDLLSRS